jgi:ABC-2 type transport system ATP-binding protein
MNQSTAPVTIDEVLVASHLAKRFGDRAAVEDVSFHVSPGETYARAELRDAGRLLGFSPR